MNSRLLRHSMRTITVVCSALLAATAAHPQSAVISLDPATLRPAATAPVKGEASYANPPANFYAFASATVGEPATVEGLRLRFAAPTTLATITSTKDFTVEPGGSCKEGQSFAKGDTCILLVRFTPQGAGPRMGHITITHSASAQPLSLGLGGNGYAPVITFNPSTISTVTGTYPSGHGLLSNAQNLAVDGGDGLYIPDTNNGNIRYINSSGTITSLATPVNNPYGIAVDTFGTVYFSEPSNNALYAILNFAPGANLINGTGTDACTFSAPCALSAEALTNPGQMTMDRENNLFFTDSGSAAVSTVQPAATFAHLFSPFIEYEAYPDAFAADAADNLYSFFHGPSATACEIDFQTAANTENGVQVYADVVGGRTCGFSGDGGQAANAEIGTAVGQITFDVAGDLYFSDTVNQRVRRVSAVTGIINTIAGYGTAGYAGDGNDSLHAFLSSPTGVAVDSQGQVYIISSTTVGGTSQVIRKLGPHGEINFSSQNTGTAGAVRLVNVSNIGNAVMTLTSFLLNGTNPGDFSIDPNTTSCLLTVGATLAPGQSCNIGVIFNPTVAGSRSATLTFLDNTVTNTNIVQLSGIGLTPAPAIKTAPASVAFPPTAPDHSSAQTITLTNSGDARLTIDSIAASGLNPTMFTYTSTCGSSLAPKATCTLLVNFHPSSTGSYSAIFKIADNAPDSPQTISVAGTTTTPVPTTIHFASIANQTGPCGSVAFQVQVSSTSGGIPSGTVHLKRADLVLDSAELKNGAAAFSIAGLASGSNLIFAAYDGDQIHNPSTSSILRQVIPSGQACIDGGLPLHF